MKAVGKAFSLAPWHRGTVALGLLLSAPVILAACGGETDRVFEADELDAFEVVDEEGSIVGIDSAGNEVRGEELSDLLTRSPEEKAFYGSSSDIVTVGRRATIPDGLGAPTQSIAGLNCLFQGSGTQCWFPGFLNKSIVKVCFHPDNQGWFDDVVRVVLNIEQGPYFGGYSFLEAAFTGSTCQIVVEEKFDIGGPFGEAPVVYLNSTTQQPCGPSNANTCLFYGKAALRIWTQKIDAEYPGFPGDPYRNVLEHTINHEVGHVLGLQHNALPDPMWSYSSFMRAGFEAQGGNAFEYFYTCETQKLTAYNFNGPGGSNLSRRSATVDTANCTDY